jgi:hypothetical protein
VTNIVVCHSALSGFQASKISSTSFREFSRYEKLKEPTCFIFDNSVCDHRNIGNYPDTHFQNNYSARAADSRVFRFLESSAFNLRRYADGLAG